MNYFKFSVVPKLGKLYKLNSHIFRFQMLKILLKSNKHKFNVKSKEASVLFVILNISIAIKVVVAGIVWVGTGPILVG